MIALQWKSLPFHKLSVHELYSLLQLRQEVFIVEQNCPYLDADGADTKAIHLLGIQDNTLCCYARIFLSQEGGGSIIGRVIVHERFRGKGLGYTLMKQAHSYIANESPKNTYIKLGAQAHLRDFYGALGYKQNGEDYLEDGIPHIPMIKN